MGSVGAAMVKSPKEVGKIAVSTEVDWAGRGALGYMMVKALVSY